ncbi:hypothetical protein FEM03_13915 [Phragmitibacter flavus]|uniref:Uncharacterized protein n=1 Tax=Phragmitibacter flavus TaxID=2576071 RepID=A0A5R8KDG3_9BACT|nr:hypothetical protein [Phragmitibacter flavus]TLD70277.1 hypothetical protein FEM03_13915 [Phragmitibacter flavus]
MNRGCLKTLVLIVVFYVAISAWDSFTSRPAALYKRWLGEPVPSDVLNLTGRSQFSLAESTKWLLFKTSQNRVDEITSRLGMSKVTPANVWLRENRVQEIEVAGKTYHTNWFYAGIFHFRNHLNEIQVYWKSHEGFDNFRGGYALYFVPSTGEAFYTSISI